MGGWEKYPLQPFFWEVVWRANAGDFFSVLIAVHEIFYSLARIFPCRAHLPMITFLTVPPKFNPEHCCHYGNNSYLQCMRNLLVYNISSSF